MDTTSRLSGRLPSTSQVFQLRLLDRAVLRERFPNPITSIMIGGANGLLTCQCSDRFANEVVIRGDIGDLLGLNLMLRGKVQVTQAGKETVGTERMGVLFRAFDGARVLAGDGNIRRGEDFMRANATHPIRLADISAASRCSVRVLAALFRRYRDTPLLGALRALRLAYVRMALLDRKNNAATAAIASRFGFTNAWRFATAYRARFGESSAETAQGAVAQRRPRASGGSIPSATLASQPSPGCAARPLQRLQEQPGLFEIDLADSSRLRVTASSASGP